MIIRDMKSMGYVFQHSKMDAQDYLLTQRRTRVYGLGDLDSGQDLAQLSENMASTLGDLATDKKFPFNEVFQSNLPTCTLKKNALEKVEEAINKSMVDNESQNIFIDTSTSKKRTVEMGYGVATCVRPSHPIFSVQLQRFVTVSEMFKCQGIFKEDLANPRALVGILQKPGPAQDLAGNAFASTCAQSQLIASLVHARGWMSIAGCIMQTEAAAGSQDDSLESLDKMVSSLSMERSSVDKRKGSFESDNSQKRCRTDPSPADVPKVG